MQDLTTQEASVSTYEQAFGVNGKCHVCKQELAVKLCDLCQHYMCFWCRLSPQRLVSAVEDVMFGSGKDCCGPNAIKRGN